MVEGSAPGPGISLFCTGVPLSVAWELGCTAGIPCKVRTISIL
jgi:hypothetical protein